MKKIVHFIRKVFFNEYLLYISISLYQQIVAPQVRAAWSLYLKSRIQNFPNTAKFQGKCVVTCPSKIKIGPYVRVGYGCFFFCDGGLEIGEATIISRYVTIYTGNHNTYADIIPYDNTYIYRPVKIGRGVWIGMNVSITPGVTIGDGAVIGMGAVISKDVPTGAVVVGAAQRIVSYRDKNVLADSMGQSKYFSKHWPNA